MLGCRRRDPIPYLDQLQVGLPVLDLPAVVGAQQEARIVAVLHRPDGRLVRLHWSHGKYQPLIQQKSQQIVLIKLITIPDVDLAFGPCCNAQTGGLTGMHRSFAGLLSWIIDNHHIRVIMATLHHRAASRVCIAV